MPNVSNVPPYRAGKPSLGIFICKRCGDGVVAHTEAEGKAPAVEQRKHVCHPWTGSHPGDELDRVLFHALLDLPDNGRAH